MLFIKALQVYAWAAFLAAWAHMGWVDWTQQKIRNKYLLFWLRFAVLGYALLAAHTLSGSWGYLSTYLLWGYYRALGLYVGFSALAAYALWALRVWPAGDVKLFALLALFYPLMGLPASFRSGARFLEVLINVFVPAAAWLFVTAAFYLWRTRLSHQKDFLVQLGTRRLAPFLAAKAREAAAGFKAEWLAWVEAYRNPWRLLLDAAAWLAMMVVMSMISYALNDVIASTLARTLICFGLFFVWSRFCQSLGKGWVLGLVFGAFAVLLWHNPQVNWARLIATFSHISVFSLCLFFGVQIAFKIVAGQTAFLVLPFLFMLPSLVPWATLWAWAGPAAGSLAPNLRLPAGLGTELGGIAVWAAMGLFFGLALVFVRIWDAESYTSVAPEQIAPFMTLGPAMVSLISQDEDFREEYFQTFYADGLTPEQVSALRAWCSSRGIGQVPLAPTISFANWIFFGYFLTHAIDGHALRWLY